MDSDSASSPPQRSRTGSDASDYIQAAQTLTREGNAEAIQQPDQTQTSSSGMSQSQKPEMIRRYLTREEKRAMMNAYNIFDMARACNASRKGSESNSDASDYDDDSLEDTSISDFHDSEVDDEMKEVPVETFVKNTRIIYPNGDVKYLSGSKDS